MALHSTVSTAPGLARCRPVPRLRSMCSRHLVTRKHICAADAAPFDVKRFEQLDSSYRNRVLDAVQKLKNRATAAEVAAEAGIPIKEADRYMQSLVQDVQGGMKVSSAGDLVYNVPGDFRARLLRNSFKLRIEPTLKAVGNSAAYLTRLAFGTALFASILVTSVAIIALLSAGSSDRDNSRSSRSSGRSWDDGGPGFRFNVFHWDPYTAWFWDPYYPVKARQRAPQDMGFLESVFSVVFGDGDPNATFEEERWAQVATYIKAHGGVVSAIELAPLLDPADIDSLQDEAYILPALLKFDGEVKVMDDGSTVYVFPQFQRVTSPTKRPPLAGAARVADSLFGTRSLSRKADLAPRGQTAPALEKRWALSKAPLGGKVAAWALGLANIGGVAYLSSLMSSVSARALAANGLAWIPSVLPGLQAYAALFAVIPAVRALLNLRRNFAIDRRNAAREHAAEVLATPAPSVRGKLAQAQRLAQTTTIAEDDVVYDSFTGQGKNKEDRVLYEDFASFDRRLADSQRRRQRES